MRIGICDATRSVNQQGADPKIPVADTKLKTWSVSPSSAPSWMMTCWRPNQSLTDALQQINLHQNCSFQFWVESVRSLNLHTIIFTNYFVRTTGLGHEPALLDTTSCLHIHSLAFVALSQQLQLPGSWAAAKMPSLLNSLQLAAVAWQPKWADSQKEIVVTKRLLK